MKRDVDAAFCTDLLYFQYENSIEEYSEMLANRRSFLRSSSLVAVGAGISATSLIKPPKAFSQSSLPSPDVSLINSSATCHNINVANWSLNKASSSDWSNASSIQQSVHASWKQQQMDSLLAPAYAQTAEYINQHGFPSDIFQVKQIAVNIAAYNPAFQADTLAGLISNYLSFFDPGALQTYAISVCEQGMLGTIQTAIDDDQIWAQTWGALQAYYFGVYAPPPPVGGEQAKNRFARPAISDACGQNGTAALFAGVGFLTLAVMAGGFPAIAAGVLEGVAWGAIANYGGGVATGYGVIVGLLCP